eukprot:COSAG03_NODE_276_length_9556_cov_8.462360_2_plen_522_part_00
MPVGTIGASGSDMRTAPSQSSGDLSRAQIHSLIHGLNQLGGPRDADAHGSLSMRGLQELEDAKAEAVRVEHESRETFRRFLAEKEASRVQLQEVTESQRELRKRSGLETMFAIEYHAQWRDSGDFGVVRKGWLQDLRLLPPGQTRSSLHRSTWQLQKKAAAENATSWGAPRQQAQGPHSTAVVEPEPVPEPEPEHGRTVSGPELAHGGSPPLSTVRPDDVAEPPRQIPDTWEPLGIGTGSDVYLPSPPQSDAPKHKQARPAATSSRHPPSTRRTNLSARTAVWQPAPLTPRSSHRPANPPRTSHPSAMAQPPIKRASQISPRAQVDRGILPEQLESTAAHPILSDEDRKKVGSALRPVALPRATLRIPATATGRGGGSAAPVSRRHAAGSARGSCSFRWTPRVAANASTSTSWHVNDNLSDSEWSLTLVRVVPPAPTSGFGSHFDVFPRASTPELQRLLRSPAPPLAPRMVDSMREHQERGRVGRLDKIAIHTAQHLQHNAVDSTEPFVRGGPGMELLPRF